MTRTDWADTDIMPMIEVRHQHTVHARRSSLREALTTCFHDRRRIALAFLVPFLATIVLSFLPSPRYTSEATLLLRLGREYLYTPEVGDANAASPMAYDREQTLHAEVEILMSRDVEDSVLAKLGVEAVYPAIVKAQPDPHKQLDAAVLQLHRGLDAALLKDSNVVKVSFTHADAQTSAKVLNTVIEVYLEKRRTIFNNTTSTAAQTHVASLRSRLAEAENRLDVLKRTRNIQSFSEQQSLLLAQRQSIEMKLADSSLALAQSTGRAGVLKSSLATTPADVVLSNETQRSEAVESARKTLLDLRLKERDLTSKFTDNHPNVVDVRADIARTETFLQELQAQPNRSVRTGRSPVR
ncbi:MAG: chain length determinant family protein, partial [Rhizobacter sp.]|nr:chain length determinant family protein [Rhizobacter sp.]